MTIYGTPGGTPLNNTGFQGTQPGNNVQATLQVVQPGVGMFPPNADNRSGDTVLASISRGNAPANVEVTGFGVTSSAGTVSASGGRPLLEAMSKGGENGTGLQAGADYMNSDSNGSGSLGAGGANQTEGPTSGQSSQVATPQPSSTLTLQGGNSAPVYVG
jgi:hypothetical protein